MTQSISVEHEHEHDYEVRPPLTVTGDVMDTQQSYRILIVDDEAVLRRIMARWLEREHYRYAEAESAEQAWEMMQQTHFALVVLDIKMAGMSGMALLRRIIATFPETAVIMVTGVDDRSTATEALHVGAYGYLIKPFECNELMINVVNALERRQLVLSSRRYARELEETILARTSEIRATQEEVTLTLIDAMRQRDGETGAHIKRMGHFAMVLADALGWSRLDMESIRLAAPMHDIGKIGIPDAVLRKPGKLTPEEFAVMTEHTRIGEAILHAAKSPLLQLARIIALLHHEKWDGSGYPQGLAGEAIPECAQIVAVADIFDALTHDRVYRPAFSATQALEMMQQVRDSHFSPKIFDAFLTVLRRFQQINREFAEEDTLLVP
jgi:putative two-component system response regulator